MSYEPKLAAALSGATIPQLSRWRHASGAGGAVLVPEISATRPILYSFRDLVALRACVRLRQETSLQRIRRAVDSLRDNLGEREHLSEYRLVTDGGTVYLADPDHAVDLIGRKGGKGNLVIHQLVDVLAPFYRNGRHIPDLFSPRPDVAVDPYVRGGEPVIRGTRVPASEVAALIRDGIPPEQIADFFPGVSAEAALEATDFTDYVDSYSGTPTGAGGSRGAA
ncbi:DUF433 domain-containing protein [Streptomyces sp. NPDC058686]|uniref:DUF433 domain-containing protein n=1 Tax=Streptomyces sp. NPDC058686 TaxID=3346599 RepID=UPI00365298A3